ncbi:MAG: acyl-CoA dehydrogenase family protein [Gemmatimonadaceae bacterium]
MTAIDWPFFSEGHRELDKSLSSWIREHPEVREADEQDPDAACRSIVKSLGDSGWLEFAVPAPFGGRADSLDVRSLCLIREKLAYESGLADIAFAMQGLGAGPISLYGSRELKQQYLPRVSRGEAIAAFAISEADAGSDVAGMHTTARRDGDEYVIDGAKTWISNAGIADFYVVFCKGEREKEYIALVVEPSDPGFSVTERISTIAPHPLGSLGFESCRVPADRVVGDPVKGLRVALGTLDVFRTTVGAAALGFARRALAESLAYAGSRRMFGGALADLQLTQAQIAEMATDIDASALLVYRSAWTRDNGAERVTREAAMAKMYATEAAQRVIDRAVQLLGGRGVVSGNPVERLYREIRALRIYDGTTEVQKLIIAGQVLKDSAESLKP